MTTIMATKSIVLSMRVTPAMQEALTSLASRELRTVAQTAVKTLAEKLRDDGLMSDDDVRDALVRAPRANSGKRRGREHGGGKGRARK